MSRGEEKKTGVILFGGTFNPIHQGHIRLCCSAWKAVQPRLIVLMPTQPFYKSLDTDAEQRMEMCRRAAGTLPFPVVVDDYELRQGSSCRTYDTLCAMKKKFPHDPLYFLVGSDTFLSFMYWYRWQECGHMAEILVGMRSGSPAAEVRQEIQLLQEKGITAYLLPHTADGISSQSIRMNKNEKKQDLPPAVYTYIQEHHLY